MFLNVNIWLQIVFTTFFFSYLFRYVPIFSIINILDPGEEISFDIKGGRFGVKALYITIFFSILQSFEKFALYAIRTSYKKSIEKIEPCEIT